MNADKELMQQALDALEDILYEMNPFQREAIEALRARLAQPEPEPVAWMEIKREGRDDAWVEEKVLNTWDNGHGVPLYIAPPQREWQGLTDEEIRSMLDVQFPTFTDMCRAIEAKLKEKNT